MKIRLKQDAKPVRVNLRRYSPPQKAFLQRKIDELLKLGIIYKNPESQWACAPLIIPKQGPEKFRFTVDLRPVNSQTKSYTWPMPHLDDAMQELAKSTCYATIDLCHGYWQMPLEKESQECQSFITPEGVFTPTRVLHGQTNATFYFQSTISKICHPLRKNILQWLDDLLIHAETPEKLLDILGNFFEICQQHGIKLHAAKCKLFLTEVQWCGRLISKRGIRMDPRRLQGLQEMKPPVTADQLQQFICAANWMRNAIPECNKTLSPLSNILETALKKAGKRTKKAAAKIQLTDIGWTDQHNSAFNDVKNALKNSVTLAHPDPAKLLCLFTDASEQHWSGVLTQIPAVDRDIAFDQQRQNLWHFILVHSKTPVPDGQLLKRKLMPS